MKTVDRLKAKRTKRARLYHWTVDILKSDRNFIRVSKDTNKAFIYFVRADTKNDYKIKFHSDKVLLFYMNDGVVVKEWPIESYRVTSVPRYFKEVK